MVIWCLLQLKIEKNLIGNERDLTRGTKFVQLAHLCRLREMTGWIIRMHHDYSARPRRNRLLQRMKINLPSVVVDQLIAHQAHILYIGEEFEKGVAWRWNQQLVAWIA